MYPARLSRHKSQRGQVVLILLVLMALGLTVGLLVISRSTLDVELSTKLEREAAVFSANEAGAENILLNPLAPGGSDRVLTINNVKVTAKASEALGPDDPYIPPVLLKSGETISVWLVNHIDTSTPYVLDENPFYTASSVDVCWQAETAGTPPAMAISVFYKKGGQYKVRRSAYRDRASSPPNPCTPSGTEDCFEKVDSASGGNCGADMKYKETLVFSDLGFSQADITNGTTILLDIRLRPILPAGSSNASIAMKPFSGSTLPKQVLNDAYISAQDLSTGESTRIRVFQTYTQAPAIFDYALFSGTNL